VNRVAYLGPASTIDEVLSRLKAHNGFIAVDTETVSTVDRRIIGIGFAISATEAFYFSAFQDDPESGHYISPYFQEALSILADSRRKVWFNASFDLEVLEPFLPNYDQTDWQDVSIMCRVQAMHNSLEMNAGEYLGRTHTTIQDILPKGKNMLSLPMPDVAWKCMNDCIVTWLLWYIMEGGRWIDDEPSGFIWRDGVNRPMDVTPEMVRAYRLDRELIPLLRKMGKKGLKLDIPLLRKHYTRLAEEKFRYLDICQQKFGFNPGSNQQTGYTLATRGNFLPWTKNGAWKQFAVDGANLSQLTDPLAAIVMEYRKRADQLSDVIEPLLGKPPGEKGKRVPYKDWQAFDRFTTHFRLDLATSRLASYDRNIQNITPELRAIFTPDSGTFTWWDMSQIEMRIFAYLSQDPVLLQAYREGQSIHMLTMEALFPGQPKIRPDGSENPLYVDSKTFNFAMIYNAKATTLATHTRRPVDLCTILRAQWLDRYPRARDWMVEAEEEGLQHMWVETLEGRRCRLPDIMQQGEEHTRTCAINYRVQGAAAWPVKVALLQGDKDGYDQRVQLHDEVLIDGDVAPPVEAYRWLMGELETPVETYHGAKWS